MPRVEALRNWRLGSQSFHGGMDCCIITFRKLNELLSLILTPNCKIYSRKL